MIFREIFDLSTYTFFHLTLIHTQLKIQATVTRGIDVCITLCGAFEAFTNTKYIFSLSLKPAKNTREQKKDEKFISLISRFSFENEPSRFTNGNTRLLFSLDCQTTS